MIAGSHPSSVIVRASIRAGSSTRHRWLLVRASRPGYGSKRQPRRPLALLAALMLIAALAPPMASAMTRDGTEGVSMRAEKDRADEILRELLGSVYGNYQESSKDLLRECTRDNKCLMTLQYQIQLSKAH
jgi:hypothetical protein